jgi:hypothetical protein
VAVDNGRNRIARCSPKVQQHKAVKNGKNNAIKYSNESSKKHPKTALGDKATSEKFTQPQ